MARKGVTVEVDFRAADGLIAKLNTISTDTLAEVALRTVNEVVEDVYQLVVPRVSQRVNLVESYVRTRISVEKGTNKNSPVASVVASGSKSNMTRLANYAPRQLVQVAKHPKRSKGDPRAGIKIAQGMKSAGISVEVTRGSRKSMPGAFLMQLKNNNGMGVFTRGTGDKKVKHRYGPSVYQLFKTEAVESAPDASEMLATRLLDNIDIEIKKVLA